MLCSPLSIRRSATSLPRYCSRSPTSRDLFEGFTRDISDWKSPSALRTGIRKAISNGSAEESCRTQIKGLIGMAAKVAPAS